METKQAKTPGGTPKLPRQGRTGPLQQGGECPRAVPGQQLAPHPSSLPGVPKEQTVSAPPPRSPRGPACGGQGSGSLGPGGLCPGDRPFQARLPHCAPERSPPASLRWPGWPCSLANEYGEEEEGPRWPPVHGPAPQVPQPGCPDGTALGTWSPPASQSPRGSQQPRPRRNTRGAGLGLRGLTSRCDGATTPISQMKTGRLQDPAGLQPAGCGGRGQGQSPLCPPGEGIQWSCQRLLQPRAPSRSGSTWCSPRVLSRSRSAHCLEGNFLAEGPRSLVPPTSPPAGASQASWCPHTDLQATASRLFQ